jgi:hypothetical protein
MIKILGSKDNYYDQTNNAQVDLFKDYFKKGKMISCGPEAFVTCLDIAGYPMDIFTPGEQPGDSVLMICHNRKNLPAIMKNRVLDYDKYPPNEVPQTYEVVAKLLYKDLPGTICKLEWGVNFAIIKKNIDKNIPMMLCGKFPCGGHFVAVTGYDDSKNLVKFNDPYPLNWPDKKGYNRDMDLKFLQENIISIGNYNWRIEIYPYKP